MSIYVPLPMMLYCDNEAAVTLASRGEILALGRTKYFNRLIWKIHEQVTSGMVEPKWISTVDMPSDIGTKALMGSNFDRISNQTFSRMHMVKEHESVPVKSKSKAKSAKTVSKPVSGGKACDDDNQLSDSMSVSTEASEPSISHVKAGSGKASGNTFDDVKTTKTGGQKPR